MNTSQAIIALKSGSKDALKHIVYKYSKDLIKVASRYTRDLEEAKDVLQDSFISIYQNINQLRDSDENSFQKWSTRIVINTAIRKYRRKYYSHENTEINYSNHPQEEESINTDLNLEDIYVFINQLSDSYRTVFKLYAIDGFSHKDIAELLAINESTARSQYLRARKILQKKLIHTNALSHGR